MVRTDIGECGIVYGGEEYIFSPSFFAMSQLGDKKQVVDLLKTYSTRSFVWNMADCFDILTACCTSHTHEDLAELIGTTVESKRSEGFTWKCGTLPMGELASFQIIAERLLWMGVIGKPNKYRLEESESEPLEEFDATEYATAAIALFKIGRDDAWQMTMVEFQRAVDTLHPPKREKPTRDEADDLFAVTDDINEKLNQAKQG